MDNKEIEKIFERNKVLIDHQNSNKGSRSALKSLKGEKNLTGVEIGVFFGINSLNILETLDISFLILIDPFSDEELKNAYAKCITSDVEIIARENLKDYNDKIKIIKDFSYNVADQIPDDLDFIYIDGDHSEEGIKKDIELYYPKVKSGGLFGGHDYIKDRSPDLMVKGVVDSFFKDKDEILNSRGRDWWVIKK